MSRILITGAFGQLGTSLRNILSDQSILAAGRMIPMKEKNGCALLDITELNQVRETITLFQPDVIVHLAAMTDVDGCERDPELAFDVNVRGTENLLDNFSGRFIYISTDYVFDGTDGPYGEDDETNPISVYGQTKLAADKWLTNNHPKVTIFRANVVYGYTKRTKASFVKWVVDSLSDGKPIHVVDDQWNNPTWTESIATVIKVLIEKEALGLYHYGDKEYMNRYEFAHLIAKVFDLDASLISPISTADLKQPAPRPLKSGLKTEKIESALGIVPNSVETCLQEIRKQLSR